MGPANQAGRGTLLVIEGIDGAGKSTLAAAVVAELEQRRVPVLFVNKAMRRVDGDDELSARIELTNSFVYGDRSGGERWGDYHWLFALAAWYSVIDRCVIRPALTRGTHVVLDNGPRKILARYLVEPDFPAGLAQSVFEHLTPPDRTVLLDIRPVDAAARKGKFTDLEAGFLGAELSDFVTYQERVRSELLKMSSDLSWSVFPVSALSRDEVLAMTLKVLDQAWGP